MCLRAEQGHTVSRPLVFPPQRQPAGGGGEVLPVRPVCRTRLGIGEDVLGERPRRAYVRVAGRGLGNLRGFRGLLGRLCGVDLPVGGRGGGG